MSRHFFAVEQRNMSNKMSAVFCVAVLVVLVFSNGLQLSGSNELSTINFNISIERGPTFGVVMPGGNITMDCMGHCSEPSLCRVAWYFKGFAVLPTEKQKFFPNGSLQILDFKMENGGEYMCMVASNPFARLSRSAVVELAVIQKEMRKIYEERVAVGGNVLLSCYTEGVPDPKVMWTKHSRQMFFSERAIQSVASITNSLQLYNVTPEDGGLYKCHASNMVGNVVAATYIVNVTKTGTSKVIKQLSVTTLVEVMLDEPVTLECLWSFSGSIWYRGAVLLANSTKLGSNLFIESASFSDIGIYTCRSSENFLLYTDIRLTVYTMPFLLTRRQVYAKVRTGAEINLLSVYIAHPTPDVRWFKNGLLLQESKKRPRMKLFVKKQNFPAHQAELSILDSTLSDFGIYQCVVYNRFGSFDVTFFVAIYEPVKPPEKIRTRPVMDGEIEVTWEPPADLEGTFVYYSVYYWSQYDRSEKWMTTNKTGIVLIRLLPFTNYSFYVRTHAHGVISEPSEFVSQMTNEEDLPLSLPQVTLVVENSSAITVHWTKLTSRAANGVIVMHKVLVRTFEDSKIKTHLVHGSVYNLTLKDLKPETRYDIVVLSGNNVGYPKLEDFEQEEYNPWETIFLSAEGIYELYFPEDLKVEVTNFSTATISWKVNRKSKDVELYGYVFQYKNHKAKTLRLFANEPARSVVLNGLVPGHSYEVIIHSMSELGPGTPTALIVNILEQMKEVESTTATRTTHPIKSTVELRAKVPSNTDAQKFLPGTKVITIFLAKQKEDVSKATSSVTPALTEHNLKVFLTAEALNDTTVLISLSATYGFFERNEIAVCFGVYDAQAATKCREWPNGDDSSRGKIHVGGLRPMTKYFFWVQDKKGWLSDVVVCSTAVPSSVNSVVHVRASEGDDDERQWYLKIGLSPFKISVIVIVTIVAIVIVSVPVAYAILLRRRSLRTQECDSNSREGKVVFCVPSKTSQLNLELKRLNVNGENSDNSETPNGCDGH